MKPPRLRGTALTAARLAAENSATSALLETVLKQSLGLDRIAALPPGTRSALSMSEHPLEARSERALPHDELPLPASRAWPRTSADLRAAYDQKRETPAQICDRAYAYAQKLSDNRVHNVLAWTDEARTRRESQESLGRFETGAARGPLEGVPYLVKDEVDVAGLPTRVGSLTEPETPRAADSTVVARLAQAGAVFVGKTVMTEFGMSPLGQNQSFRMPTNAHHAERCPGGSSSGSGVAVALGVVPLAIGTDGGGSVRIPAALNGVFGIKPTFGRVSRAGSLSGSVGHVGPIGASTRDLALFLDAVSSSPDPLDPLTRIARPAPRGGFGSRLGAGVKKLRIGVLEGEWAIASEPVAKACRAALAALEKDGAEIVPISIPLASVSAPIGYLTIGCESVAANLDNLTHRRALMGDDLRLSFAVLRGISASEFVDSQRLRATLRAETARALGEVDLIALPTTATTAPDLPVGDRGKAFADTEAIDAMCRFNFLGNLTGLPGGTAPVGLDDDGLPIGLQLLGDAWDEAIVLGAMAHLERLGVAEVQRPKAALDLLP